MSIPYPRPAGDEPHLDRVLRILSETIPEPEWDAEIQRRTVALIRHRGESLHSVAEKGDHAHSWLAKKLGVAPSSRFTRADLEEVLRILDVEPEALLVDRSVDTTGIRGVGRVSADMVEETLAWIDAPGRAEMVKVRTLNASTPDAAPCDATAEGLRRKFGETGDLRLQRLRALGFVTVRDDGGIVLVEIRPVTLKPHRHLLGQVPDSEVATLAECSRQRVAQVRKRLGIAASTKL